MEANTKPVDRNSTYEAKRLEILQKAAIAFAEDGYHQTSVNSLAMRLGVSKPVLYYYAKNKDDLLFQIGLIAREQLEEAMEDARQQNVSAMGKIRRFFKTYAEIMASDSGRCFTLVHPQSLVGAARENELTHRRKMEVSVREMIIEGQKDGSIRPCDPVLVTRAIFGAFNGLPRWYHLGGGQSAADIADVYIDLFVNGIGRG